MPVCQVVSQNCGYFSCLTDQLPVEVHVHVSLYCMHDSSPVHCAWLGARHSVLQVSPACPCFLCLDSCSEMVCPLSEQCFFHMNGVVYMLCTIGRLLEQCWPVCWYKLWGEAHCLNGRKLCTLGVQVLYKIMECVCYSECNGRYCLCTCVMCTCTCMSVLIPLYMYISMQSCTCTFENIATG